jgi:site-specific DNA recombinase
MPKKAAIYARVSTRDKKNGNDEYRQNPETQLIPCREFCQRMGWEYVEYVDRMSGSREDRPALKQLIEDTRLKKFDVVVFYKLDRLARSVKQLVQQSSDAVSVSMINHGNFSSFTDCNPPPPHEFECLAQFA